MFFARFVKPAKVQDRNRCGLNRPKAIIEKNSRLYVLELCMADIITEGFGRSPKPSTQKTIHF